MEITHSVLYITPYQKEKKIASVCIDKGIDTAYKEGLKKCEAVISAWRQGKFSTNKEAYHKLYKTLTDEDDAITRRYDGLTDSRWLITVAQLFSEKVIGEDDVMELPDETKAVIRLWGK